MSPVRILSEKIHNVRQQVRHLPAVLALTFSAAKKWTLAWTCLLALQGLLPVATIYVTRSLFEVLEGAAKTHASTRTDLIRLVALLFAVYLAGELLRSAITWVRSCQADLIQDHLNGLIHQKSTEVDLQFFEIPECHDHLHRARVESNHRSVALLESVAGIAQNLVTLVAMVVVLIPFGFWAPVAVLASTLPAFAVVLACGVRQYEWRRRTTGTERRTWYYDWILTSAPAAAELRLFDLGLYFRERYQQLRTTLRNERTRLTTAQLWAECASATFGVAISAGATLWVVLRTGAGQITLANAVVFCLAFQNGLRLMQSVLSGVEQLYSNSLFLRDLFDLLSLNPSIKDPVTPVPPPVEAPEIRFQNVSFCYPGSHTYALRKFDLVIPPKKMVALVGGNGSGKSTLVKLVCRLYDPESGSIQLNGIDIREMRVNELRRLITVLFQEPVRYNDTLAENVVMGSLQQHPSDFAIESAIEATGAQSIVENLPGGRNTVLGKLYDEGTDLSVGEWQRVALARAVLRTSRILILDEPTSAMDPWTEAEWLPRLRALAKDHTSIVITHRFTTAMHADVIHVVADGEIVESGSHADLLRKGGLYTQSWAAQMETAAHA